LNPSPPDCFAGPRNDVFADGPFGLLPERALRPIYSQALSLPKGKGRILYLGDTPRPPASRYRSGRPSAHPFFSSLLRQRHNVQSRLEYFPSKEAIDSDITDSLHSHAWKTRCSDSLPLPPGRQCGHVVKSLPVQWFRSSQPSCYMFNAFDLTRKRNGGARGGPR
jgi:hypothetical protein